ncbi:hypothetical protein WEH80_07350 [Actinomycetes bacterium KLBMP 9759]
MRHVGEPTDGSGAGVGLAGHVVRTVVLRLVDDGPSLEPAERERLITRRHRVRLVLAAVAYPGPPAGAAEHRIG